MYSSCDLYLSAIDNLGSPAFFLSSAVFASGIHDPRKLTRCSGAPMLGSRRFHPVYVASGTCNSGNRTPPRSLPSASLCGTSTPNGAPTCGGSIVIQDISGSLLFALPGGRPNI